MTRRLSMNIALCLNIYRSILSNRDNHKTVPKAPLRALKSH